MIILRQKTYGEIWDSTVKWGRRFTPRIPLGKNSNLVLLWPGTLVGAFLGVLIGLAKKVKHAITGTPVKKLHDDIEQHEERRAFSERGAVSNTKEEYERLIPGYKELQVLREICFNCFHQPKEGLKFIYNAFPTLFSVSAPELINKYRNDYINSENLPGDYAEILYMYGDELVFIYDFDRKSWYIKDTTYNPVKEWKIGGNILDAIKVFFDPERDQLLKIRLENIKEHYPDHYKFIVEYLDVMKLAIERVKH